MKFLSIYIMLLLIEKKFTFYFLFKIVFFDHYLIILKHQLDETLKYVFSNLNCYHCNF